ncbi:MAG TPA: hypothetical protein VN328_13495, partial [Thermodesulfovibrionales bacterium]|nr:hypothetical protein [Thermodesulfovibrionales bacterium]
MLDIRFVRENVAAVEEALRKRNYTLSLDSFLEDEEERRALLKESEKLRNIRNLISEEIGRHKREVAEELSKAMEEKRSSLVNLLRGTLSEERLSALYNEVTSKKGFINLLSDNMKSVSERIKELDVSLIALDEKARLFLLNMPNIPHESVPVGKDETENVVIRTWGTPREFDFPALNHWDIAEMHGIIDFDRASKIAGARFALMKGAGAKLERALMNFMLDLNTSKGYTEVFPPILVNRESMTGTGQLPKFEAELFRIADPEFYLIPTAEVPVTNIHRDEILKEQDLPIYF